MKLKDTVNKVFLKQSARAGLLLVIVAALTLEATGIVQYYFSQKGIKEEATRRAESQLEATKLKIINIIDQAEAAVRNSVWLAQWALEVPDSLYAVSRRIVENNPVIVGSTVALVPGYDKKHPLFSPYCFQAPGETGIHVSSLATEEYNYPEQEWFTKPLELQAGYWSEPYIDVGGGDILMTTYSIPLRDRYGRIAGVLTADISLDWLTDLVGNVQVYPNAYSMMISRSGRIMVCPAESLVMRRTAQEVIADMDDTAAFAGVNRSMIAGERGNATIRYNKDVTHIFYAPVEKTGWSMSISIPEDEIFSEIRHLNRRMLGLELLGLMLLLVILLYTIFNQRKLLAVQEKKGRIESELHVASGIQESMLPKTFPPFPSRHDVDIYATLVSAKEVGGDLYDFFIRDERLYFCIGDVSGKGVPASLVMSVTRSLFRTVAGHEKSPVRIVANMNQNLVEMNINDMFVTFFCGVLDLASGHLRYCNAGHNAPVILSADASVVLPVVPNLPLGVMPSMSFTEQETDLACGSGIFLYTDGLNEAEDQSNNQFGTERMMHELDHSLSANQQIERLEGAVRSFVGTAPQSDDLTMLYIRYLNDSPMEKKERHLILHNDIQQIPQLADFVETVGQLAGLSSSLTLSLNLALEEAVTNVILYAYPEGSDGLVDIEAIIHKDHLKFIISDSGKAFDPTAAPEVDITLDVEDRPIGGLGIFLVRNIMDSVQRIFLRCQKIYNKLWK